jgi:cytoskeletal protein RodZ
MPYKVKNRSKWHWKLLLPLLALVVVLAFGAWFVKSHDNKLTTTGKSSSSTNANKGSIDYSPATPADNAANESRKSSSSGSETLNSSGSTNTNGSSLTVTILNARVITDSSGNKLVHIGNIVSGATTGICTLTATKSGQPDVNDTASVQLDGNNYDCGVFNTSVSKFSSSGTWLLTLTVKSGNSADSATSSITL